MIKIESITIEEFRGIRNLTLNFKGKNYAVCGPNGTGKSGVVDALDFVLTGNISRLSGEGMGDVSVLKHGPHVDSRNDPKKAKVTAVIKIPSLNKTVTVERTVGNASSPTITPNDTDVAAVLEEISRHPEFVLSRRELIRYVIATPGKRSEEVQALLRLNILEDIRESLQKISNASKKEVPPLERSTDAARDMLLRALEIPELSKEKILEAVNQRRTLLGLPVLADLTPTTSIREGVGIANKVMGQKTPPSKAQALADMKAAREFLEKIPLPENSSTRLSLVTELSDLNDDPLAKEGATREKFLRDALPLLCDDTCPVCGTEWNMDELRQVIDKKLEHLQEISLKRKSIEDKLQPTLTILQELQAILPSLEQYAASIAPDEVEPIKQYKNDVADWRKKLDAFLPITDTIAALQGVESLPETFLAAMNTLETSIANLPEPSQQEAAKEYLILSQERLEASRLAAISLERAKSRAALSKKVFDQYNEANNTVLTSVYQTVEKDFGELYRFINQEDEGDFTAELTPSMGKLGFNVNFYGKGYFPPGAYHSEGHQDGMGLCLYLALMKHLLGASFTFAVLDDVLMSVDTGHRREVCRLLKEHFPTTQFVLTTHDEVWLRQMKTIKLLPEGGSTLFRKWSVEEGPSEWDNRDVWDEIGDDLSKNDVRSAAATLRHYLEHVSREFCHALRAPVEFRGDGRFDLGDLLPSAAKRLREILGEARASATSWGKTVDADEIKEREKALGDCYAKCNEEWWQINSVVHYNEWSNLQRTDFEPIVIYFKELIPHFYCPKEECQGLLYVVPERGPSREGLKCFCGQTNYNLIKKPTVASN